MFKVAYLKLTFFYCLIVMAISIAFSLAIYQISVKEIGRGLFRQQEKIFNQLPKGQNFEDIRRQQITESNERLKINLYYYNLVILVLSLLGSYFLARRTFRPIEEAVELQSRFTADASHELRTPLAAMKSEIEVALRDKTYNINKSKRLLKSSLEEIEKLETLSSALLELAQFKTNDRTNFEKVDLEEIIIEAYEKIEALALNKKIKFNNKLSNVSINGNRQSLQELFVILLDNAIKYSYAKSKISIVMTKAKHWANIKITDGGIGIKATEIPYIFNRFYRADASRSKENINGYGLGLSIAKEIVDLHRGTIKVESRFGKGSIFTISLPR